MIANKDRIFLRLYTDVIKSTLISELGPECWTTLCIIASYMDEKGECYPKQEQIASILGVSRQTANKYVQQLLEYRKDGKPIVTVKKVRGGKSGRWANNKYKVLPESGLEIF